MKFKRQINDNVLKILPKLKDYSFSLIFSDFPYSLGTDWFIDKDGSFQVKGKAVDFMQKWSGLTGKNLDDMFFHFNRILKHGGYVIGFGLDRQLMPFQYYAVKNGFEVCQSLYWYYCNNMPKATDVSKSIDRKYNLLDQREVVGKYQLPNGQEWNLKQAEDELVQGSGGTFTASNRRTLDITKGVTELAQKYDGYKYGRKPLKQVVENVMIFSKKLTIFQEYCIILTELYSNILLIRNLLCKQNVQHVKENLKLNHHNLNNQKIISVIEIVLQNIIDELTKININQDNVKLLEVMDILKSDIPKQENGFWNTDLLWNLLLVENYLLMKSYTTETMIEVIIELKTLNSYLGGNIHHFTTKIQNGQENTEFVMNVEKIFGNAMLTLKSLNLITVLKNVFYKTLNENPLNFVRHVISNLTVLTLDENFVDLNVEELNQEQNIDKLHAIFVKLNLKDLKVMQKELNNISVKHVGENKKPQVVETIMVYRKTSKNKTVLDDIIASEHDDTISPSVINVKDNKVGYTSEKDKESARFGQQADLRGNNYGTNRPSEGYILATNVLSSEDGRYPPNVYIDSQCSEAIDNQSGVLKSGSGNGDANVGEVTDSATTPLRRGKLIPRNDNGGASRILPKCDTGEEDNIEPFKAGRYPPNVYLTGTEEVIDKQSGITKSGKDKNPTDKPVSGFFGQTMGYYSASANYGDSGGASRILPSYRYEEEDDMDLFIYCPKTSPNEKKCRVR